MGKFTVEEIKGIIKKWAKAKSEVIVFDNKLCFKDVIPYRTAKMTELIPDGHAIEEERKNNFDIEYWRNPYFYSFEIECQITQLKLQLVFNFDSIPESTKGICEQIYNKYRMFTAKDNLDQSYRRVCLYKESIDECTDEEAIMQKMDQLFYQMKGYETFIIYKLREKDQASPQ